MSGQQETKRYEAIKIPGRRQTPQDGSAGAPKPKSGPGLPPSGHGFYEIEYGACPIEGVGKFVLKPQKIEPPEKNEIRELFYRMRDISRQYGSPYTNHNRFFDSRVRQDHARVFCRQAEFMKDFEDDYPEQVPFSSYFPYYQLMSYEQLRTYFTWRTRVRAGRVEAISLSYVFLYLYELLNNVGVDSPQDGLDKLLSFWRAFRELDASADKYVLRWLKDYHIYYGLSQDFRTFAEEQGLAGHYPQLKEPEDSFTLFCSLSKYDIRKSVFFTEETEQLIADCFQFCMEKIREGFEAAGNSFDDVFFRPTRKLTRWVPFKDALFCERLKQPDRRVVVSKEEIYLCRNNEWSFSTVLTTERGRAFIGYVMKRMESVLRRLRKYPFKITANLAMIHEETRQKLAEAGICIEKLVETAVLEFHREATKTVVTVNPASLARIRQEALVTQEALLVEEEAEPAEPIPEVPADVSPADVSPAGVSPAGVSPVGVSPEPEPGPASDGWAGLKAALSETELEALAVVLRGGGIREFADAHGVMLEVLADGINEKAMDYFGDNLLEPGSANDELALYEDYEKQVRGMLS